MDANQTLGRSDVFSAMNAGDTPYRAYTKTTLGKVLVRYWDNFTNTPAETLLEGDPRRKEDGCIVKVWTEREDAYFKRMNKSHFDSGALKVYEFPKEDNEPKEKPLEQYSDEELKAVLNEKKKKFISLQHYLNKVNSEAVLYRFLGIAEEEQLSKGIVEAISARLSEVQGGPVVESEEE